MKSLTYLIVAATAVSIVFIYLYQLDDAVQQRSANDSNLISNQIPSDASMQYSMAGNLNESTSELSLENLLESIRSAPAQFKIDNGKGAIVYGIEGTRLEFPAGIFQFADGRIPEGEIEISLTECYSLRDIVANKLSTTSNAQLIETAGMIHIKATANNEELVLKDGAAYYVSFPKNEKENMQLFYGEKKEGILNWIPAGNNQSGNKDVSDSQTSQRKSLVSNTDCFIEIVNSNLRSANKMKRMEHYNWKLQTGETLNEYFVSNFNPPLDMLEHFCILGHQSTFTMKLNRDGSIREHYISSPSTTYYDSLLFEFIKSIPPLDLKSLMDDYNYDHACILTFGKMQSQNQDYFEARFRKKYEDNKDSDVENVQASELNYFVFAASELGWLNCDRFLEFDEEKADFVVSTPNADSTMVYLIFDDMMSMMQGVRAGEKIIFKDVPVGYKVKLLGLQCNNNKPTMQVAATKTSGKIFRLEAFNSFTLNELDEQLKRIELETEGKNV